MQALGAIIPLFLVVFATIYLSLSHTSASNFSEGLDHTRALYFTVTVFSTVGFGDITEDGPGSDHGECPDAPRPGDPRRRRRRCWTGQTGLARLDREPADTP